ncbi:MAG: leucyl aminopeptidase [Romboutsia sp.]|uniref:leucyl aminopeptidase n=1 Tax=Romboutsia sp. TaxID=1965302 RepID=UPI003F2A3333
MIKIVKDKSSTLNVELIWELSEENNDFNKNIFKVFQGKIFQLFYSPFNEVPTLFVGIGKKEDIDFIIVKEVFAKISKELKKMNVNECIIDILELYKVYENTMICHMIEGLILGGYKYSKEKENNQLNCEINLCGIKESERESVEAIIKETTSIMKGVIFARNTVNAPGNKLRPYDFVNEIKDFMKDVDVEVEVLDYEKLKELKMDALVAVGDSSKFKPYLMVVRYHGNKESNENFGLIGKGVTCDTGGYCLKPSNSMAGIRGDMAGGATVIGAIHALAENKIKTNVTAIVPICENRISDSSLLVGDMISSYSGKTIEILNTDAEGRLILADAVSYGIKNERITKVLDIATLTGAVVNLLGFSIGGVMCDDDKLFKDFERAYDKTQERYLRLPFYKEHEKMLESDVADIKNLGKNHCGTLTAGLFIREFADKKPWIHMDIAGTAWTEPPIFEYQSKGATGAGITTIYDLCKGDI